MREGSGRTEQDPLASSQGGHHLYGCRPATVRVGLNEALQRMFGTGQDHPVIVAGKVRWPSIADKRGSKPIFRKGQSPGRTGPYKRGGVFKHDWSHGDRPHYNKN